MLSRIQVVPYKQFDLSPFYACCLGLDSIQEADPESNLYLLK